jgi:hypothetical protein
MGQAVIVKIQVINLIFIISFFAKKETKQRKMLTARTRSASGVT